jgi:transcriptional regulator of acetoin/glycerol metabolism
MTALPSPGSLGLRPATCAEDTETDTCEAHVSSSKDITAPHLFVALECSRPAAGAARHSLANIDRVVIGRGPARTSKRSFEDGVRTLSLFLPDRRLSAQHASLVRHGSSFVVEDLASRNGTRLNGRAIAEPSVVNDGDLVEGGHTLFRYRASVTAPLGEPADLDSERDCDHTLLATIDASLARRLTALARVARSLSPVLLLGETGTGKELLARALHSASGRGGPLVAVNCGALPATLLEAQLFGHVRGAFSGALGDAPGLVRSADGGTLFLDEIGDLPAVAQAALLRVLQEHEVLPVGAVRPVKLDLRIVAATHRPLEALVARGEFRGDLYARLAGFCFTLPALRERREDLGLMLAAFREGRAMRFAPTAGRALLAYDWPMNVRELQNIVRSAAALAGEGPIEACHLRLGTTAGQPERADATSAVAFADPVHERLLASLARHEGNVSAVARDLGKARMQIQRWLRRFAIDPRSFQTK